MAKKPKFDVISPDGISIHFSDTYKSREEAKKKLDTWVKRFEIQGYYSSNRGRISLSELANHCEIVEV